MRGPMRAQPRSVLAQVVQPGRHNRLLPKIYVNLGITQEADGRLHAACDNYRCTSRWAHCAPVRTV